MMKDGRYFSMKDCRYYWLHIEKHGCNYIDCDRCGKTLKTVYVLQDEDGYEGFYGAECIKDMSLKKA